MDLAVRHNLKPVNALKLLNKIKLTTNDQWLAIKEAGPNSDTCGNVTVKNRNGEVTSVKNISTKSTYIIWKF